MEEMSSTLACGKATTQLRKHPRVRVSAPFDCSVVVEKNGINVSVLESPYTRWDVK